MRGIFEKVRELGIFKKNMKPRLSKDSKLGGPKLGGFTILIGMFC